MRLFEESTRNKLANNIAADLGSLIADHLKFRLSYEEIVALQSMPIRITFDYVRADDGISDMELVKFETIKEGKIRKH